MKPEHTEDSMSRPDAPFEKRQFPETKPHKRPSVIQKPGKVQLQYNEVSSIIAKAQSQEPGKNMDETFWDGAAFVAKDEDPEEVQMINKYLHKKFGKFFTTT